MNSFETYCVYHALKLHFTTPGYDYFKYRGKVKVSVSSFEKRKDRHFFLKINKKYPVKEPLEDFLVSVFMMNKKMWVGDCLSEEVSRYHANRQRICQSLTYNFKEELGTLLGLCNSPKEMLRVSEGFPILLEELMGNRVSIETVCVLNGLVGFIQYWKDNIKDDFIWPEYYERIIKYSPFLKYDKRKYAAIIDDMAGNQIKQSRN